MTGQHPPRRTLLKTAPLLRIGIWRVSGLAAAAAPLAAAALACSLAAMLSAVLALPPILLALRLVASGRWGPPLYGLGLARRLNLRSLAAAAGVDMDALGIETLFSRLIAVSLLLAPWLAALAPAVSGSCVSALLGAAAYLTPLALPFWFKLQAYERARRSEEELPFLALWAWLLERSGAGTLKDALRHARLSGLLKGFAGDAGRDPGSLASLHPSRRVARFYSYYQTIVSSGGDVTEYLGNVLDDTINMLRGRWLLHSEKIGSVATALMGLIAVTGILALMMQLMGDPKATIIAIEASALLAAVGWVSITASQPRLGATEARAPAAPVVAVITALAATVAGKLLALNTVETVVAAIAAATTGYGLVYSRAAAKTSAEEEELKTLLRLAIEALRSTPDKPLRQLLLEASSAVDEPLRSSIRRSLAQGRPVALSWTARYVIYTLENIASRIGVIDPLPLEKLYDLIQAHTDGKRLAQSRLRILAGLAYSYPPLIVAAAEAAPKAAGTLQLLPLNPIAPASALAMAAAQAAALAALAAKASTGTIRSAHYIGAALAATLAAKALTPHLLH